MVKRSCRFQTPLSVTVGRVLSLLLGLLLLLRVVTSLNFAKPDENYLYVYVLDVGQSDAVLLRCGEKTMLIDAATATEEQALHAELSRYGIKHLDYLVLTHPHEDHVGNARWVMENLAVETVLLPAAGSEDFIYDLICDTAARCSVAKTAEAGQAFSLGGAKVEALVASGYEDATTDEDVNNAGTVLRVQFGEQVLLFMGDAEAEAELSLLSAYGAQYLDCDFLKVGHHGSATSTTELLLAAATPTVAAISCGRQNTYGFPHEAVLQNLTAFGTHIYRTDQSGTLVFGTDGKELRLIPPDTKGLSL
ncbi:MAG: MBL fold metallo-hydrolase [Clostridia bacterium]|nr:MBL fold metallo-hydrolase [Clostridia bacterium]